MISDVQIIRRGDSERNTAEHTHLILRDALGPSRATQSGGNHVGRSSVNNLFGSCSCQRLSLSLAVIPGFIESRPVNLRESIRLLVWAFRHRLGHRLRVSLPCIRLLTPHRIKALGAYPLNGENRQTSQATMLSDLLLTLIVITSVRSVLSFDPHEVPLGWTTVYSCAVDFPSRILTKVNTTVSAMTTVKGCIELCDASGYNILYAGVENGNECHCGTGLAAAPEQVDVSECSTPCSGDFGLSCGGSWRIQVRLARQRPTELRLSLNMTDLPITRSPRKHSDLLGPSRLLGRHPYCTRAPHTYAHADVCIQP